MTGPPGIPPGGLLYAARQAVITTMTYGGTRLFASKHENCSGGNIRKMGNSEGISLSSHFTYGKLLRFTMPSIVMMFLTYIYGVVNGLLISNYGGEVALVAINLFMPVLGVFSVFGFLIGSGGAALIALALGRNDREKADSLFTTVIVIALAGGLLLAAAGLFITPRAAKFLGAEGEVLKQGLKYSVITLLFTPAVILQYVNQYMFPTAEKANLGMRFTIAAGVSNVLFSILFIVVLRWGIAGAALANGIGQVIGGLLPLVYFFSKKNDSLLHISKPEFIAREFGQMCVNGSSELVTNLSMYLIGILYNYQLMKYMGDAGVAIFGVIMSINMLFVAVFIGYSIGISPAVGFNLGAGNTEELKNLLNKSLKLIAVFGVLVTALSIASAKPLAWLYVGYNRSLCEQTTRAFRIYSTAFLVMGFNVFGSAFFTALNNGKISAAISFSRTLLFQSLAVLVLPLFFGETGIWTSALASEIMSLGLTAFFLVTQNRNYHYF